MDFERFKRVLTTFADSSKEIEISRGQLIVQVHGEVIAANLNVESGEVFVEQEGVRMPGQQWLIEGIAKIPLLANRILSYTQEEKNFVTPSGQVLDDISRHPSDDRRFVENTMDEILGVLNRRVGGSTTVVYLTSDAGEGKTTLINEIARRQASAYKQKQSWWLILPVSLMGRTFLRFDDVMIGSLMNRYRFPMLYFESLIELTKLGVIVPALDGFEEVWVEQEGEALSAVGNLMSNLDSEGALLISTRKAFYELKSFTSQAKLFDAIGNYNVEFCQVALDRWKRTHFIEYASKVGFDKAPDLYESLASTLGGDHAFLTRAFLVKSLLGYLKDERDVAEAIKRVTAKTDSLLFTFINQLIERETTKWIDKSGDPPQPLLSPDEHHEILSLIADEMWRQSSDTLSTSMITGLAEIFSDSKKYSPSKTRQVTERIKQHALLISTANADQYSFDHEEFKNFFLGESLARDIEERNSASVKSALRLGSLPDQTLETICSTLTRKSCDKIQCINFLHELSSNELGSSFVKENVGAIILQNVSNSHISDMNLKDLLFPQDSLYHKSIKGVVFSSCMFQSTDVTLTELVDVRFVGCHFDTLEIGSDNMFTAVKMEDCDIKALVVSSREYSLYSPSDIEYELGQCGIEVSKNKNNEGAIAERRPPDDELQVIDKILRAFTRSTGLNENVLRLKAGHFAGRFFDSILPDLIKHDALEEIPYQGSGRQRRFRLKVKMQDFQQALSKCRGNYATFLDTIKRLGSNKRGD